jgi:hypothetical protein
VARELGGREHAGLATLHLKALLLVEDLGRLGESDTGVVARAREDYDVIDELQNGRPRTDRLLSAGMSDASASR